ncbi:MAG TPA: hypothetical protein PL126_07540 [Candidatus Cloacimonadota bacterium]|nr:hypothetical protein [Candidatus Cloacimonadota bacterium]
MKRILLILLPLVIALLLAGCIGRDGKDGAVLLKIRLIDVTRYWDNNGAIPYGFNTEVFYTCAAGTYSFEYDCTDETKWKGHYTLERNYGEDGGFMRNGEDGLDRFYTFSCSISGPSLTFYEEGREKTVTPIITDDDMVEIIHDDGAYKIHIKATRNGDKVKAENPKYLAR